MKFYITLNMPSRSGNSIHQVIGEHEAESVHDFVYTLNECDFIVVEEFYRKQDGGGYYSVGDVILYTAHIGKVKASGK